ncbi:N-acetylglucosamine-6-phosphate deacetylase [Bacillaceae bacterium W0354]
MKSIIIEHINIYAEKEVINDGSILVRDGKIEKISDTSIDEDDIDIVDGAGLNLVPGFIDGHIHGALGYDVMDDDEAALRTMAQALPAEGTTTFVATTITNPLHDLERAIERVRDYESQPGEAEIIGLHIEGPFIEKSKAGAQPEKDILTPDREVAERFLEKANGLIKTMTIAPELDEDGSFIKFLVENGVNVSAGHTDANYKEIVQAVERGVSQLTHLCNAMNGVHHRDVGAVGAAILIKDLYSEIIADGIHISDEMLTILYQSIGPERLMLITDSMRAKGKDDGTYTLGGQEVTVKNGMATLADGTLAGSILKMDEGVRHFMKATGATFVEMIQMASINPAKQLAIFDRKGSIKEGKDADFLIVDDQFNIKQTYCKGILSYVRGL